MANFFKIVMALILFVGSYMFSCLDAHARITHVSINQQQFTLGEYPKFKMNIVSKDANYKKMQFIVQQGNNEEILMTEPINRFLLQLTGVEDVNDPTAVLIVKEYRVNKWRNVKRFPLFSADVKPISLTVNAEPSRVKNEIKVGQNRPIPLQVRKPDEALADIHCSLNSSPGQTLWRIALRYRKEWQMTTYGSVVAIYEANQQAFNAQNINSLKEGGQLFCPSNAVKDKYRDRQVAQSRYKELLD
jgi:FimV-like protein